MSRRKIVEKMRGSKPMRLGDSEFCILDEFRAIGLVRAKSHNWSSHFEVVPQAPFFFSMDQIHLICNSQANQMMKLKEIGRKLAGKTIELGIELDGEFIFEGSNCRVLDFLGGYRCSRSNVFRDFVSIELGTPISEGVFLRSTQGRNWQVFGDHHSNEFCFANNDEILANLREGFMGSYGHNCFNIDGLYSILLSRTTREDQDDRCVVEFVWKGNGQQNDLSYYGWNRSFHKNDEHWTQFLETQAPCGSILPIEEGIRRIREIFQIFKHAPRKIELSENWKKGFVFERRNFSEADIVCEYDA